MGQSEEQTTSNGFPAGMRVLAVDDDSVVLRTLERLLLKCGYKVTVTHHALEALKLLRVNKDQYDIVISDVNMPDMDGFKLLEIVGLEMDLPVIMLSVDCDVKTVMKGIMHGAVDYLVKPVRLEELKLIWKHVVRRSLKGKLDSNDTTNKHDYAEKSKDVHKINQTKDCKDHKKDRDDDDSGDSDEDMAAHKKPRVTWNTELHTKFINVVKELGVSRAVPKKILDMMDISGLTRENVASHLQKYRKGLKKNEMELKQQLFNHAGISGYNGSSLSMTVNNQRKAICSFERSQAKFQRNMSVLSSHVPAQQSSQVPSACLSHSLNFQNNLCRQYTVNPNESQLGTQHLRHPNSYMAKASTQVLSYQPCAPRSSQLDSYVDSCSQNSELNSVYQIGHSSDHITVDMHLRNNLFDNYSTVLDASLLAYEGQKQLNSCIEEDTEIGAHVNWDSLDVQSSNYERYMGCSPIFSLTPAEYFSSERAFSFEKVGHMDDLHAAFKQFQR